MALAIDPTQLLGRPYTEFPALNVLGPPHCYLRGADEGVEDKFHLRADDGSWELLLDPRGVIHTVFVWLGTEPEAWMGLHRDLHEADLKTLLGEPSRQGAASDGGVLGPMGAWARWDGQDFALHAQWAPGPKTGCAPLHLLTWMQIERTP